nr:hypothetical protein [Tanacetum cinerariifolium]
FWTTVTVKKVNDVTRLQSLVYKKNVVITKATIRYALRLDDAEGVECLPNEEIFSELARMGYEKPSTKLTFYKKQVSDLSTHTTKYTSPSLTQKVFANMRRVGKWFSRVDTPLFEGVVSAAADVVPAAVNEPSIPSPTPPTPPPQPSHDIPSTSQDKIAQALEITKLKSRVKKLERRNRATKLKRLKKVGSAQRIDTSDDTVMDDEEESEPAKLQEVVDVVTTAKIITEVVSAASDTITAASITIPAVDVPIPAATTAAAPTLTATPSRRRKGVVVRDPEETTTTSIFIHSEAKSKDKGKGILVEEPKALKKYQALKRKPQTKAQARKSMMIYLRNVTGFKMDYFKEQMDEEDNRALKRLNESQEEKAAKKQKLDEKVEVLKRHLQTVPSEEDDVYTEATPLALKVPVVDYEIYNENNKPYYKIKRADGSHQLYLSFLSLLRNFDRKDLEALWRLKNQKSVHGQEKVKSWKLLESCGVQIITFTTTQLILLVEKRYPLTRFTLDQMLNNVRLKVEEESEVSLELLSFGVDAAEESQGKHAKCLVLPSQDDAVD